MAVLAEGEFLTSLRTALLFSYGTLQNRDVQIANFGRELTGHEDALPGYTTRMIESAGESYANAIPSSDPDDVVPGTVFEVTDEDLVSADAYEEDADYRRIRVTLRSGDEAWVYVRG